MARSPDARSPAGSSNDAASTPTPNAIAGRELSRQARQENARRRVAAANARDAAAQARDAAAAARDLAAELRDRKSSAVELAAVGDSQEATGPEVLLRAAQYRRAAAINGAAAAEARASAAAERARAATDRLQAARDRARAQLDRRALLRQLTADEPEEQLETHLPRSGLFDEPDAALADGVQAAYGFRGLFWRVFGASQSPMLLLDQDRRIVAANQAETAMLGYSREDMLGQRLDRFCGPDEWQLLDTNWRTFQRRGVFSGDRRMMRADGEPLTVQYAAQWVHFAGRSVALQVVLSTDAKAPATATLSAGTGVPLSARELEVLGWVALGRRAYEIAAELGIASTTVESHVRSGMRKVGARSQAQLVAVACAQGLLDLSAAAPSASSTAP
jgi:PAS domain S-box-containing protein